MARPGVPHQHHQPHPHVVRDSLQVGRQRWHILTHRSPQYSGCSLVPHSACVNFLVKVPQVLLDTQITLAVEPGWLSSRARPGINMPENFIEHSAQLCSRHAELDCKLPVRCVVAKFEEEHRKDGVACHHVPATDAARGAALVVQLIHPLATPQISNGVGDSAALVNPIWSLTHCEKMVKHTFCDLYLQLPANCAMY